MTQDDGRVLERWVFETRIDESKPESVVFHSALRDGIQATVD